MAKNIVNLKDIFGENVDLSSLQSTSGEKPSQEAIDQANFRLQNPIDLNVVGFAAAFPICSVKPPKRTAMSLSYISDFEREFLQEVHLTFAEIEQVMKRFVEEVGTLKLNISPACTGMHISHDFFSYDLCFYVNDLESKDANTYDVDSITSYYMRLRRNSGDGIVFFHNEFRFYELLLDAELSRRYIAGEYELPSVPKVDYGELKSSGSVSFDDLQSDV